MKGSLSTLIDTTTLELPKQGKCDLNEKHEAQAFEEIEPVKVDGQLQMLNDHLDASSAKLMRLQQDLQSTLAPLNEHPSALKLIKTLADHVVEAAKLSVDLESFSTELIGKAGTQKDKSYTLEFKRALALHKKIDKLSAKCEPHLIVPVPTAPSPDAMLEPDLLQFSQNSCKLQTARLYPSVDDVSVNLNFEPYKSPKKATVSSSYTHTTSPLQIPSAHASKFLNSIKRLSSPHRSRAATTQLKTSKIEHSLPHTINVPLGGLDSRLDQNSNSEARVQEASEQTQAMFLNKPSTTRRERAQSHQDQRSTRMPKEHLALSIESTRAEEQHDISRVIAAGEARKERIDLLERWAEEQANLAKTRKSDWNKSQSKTRATCGRE